MKLRLRFYRKTFWHFENEGRLGRVTVLRHGVRNLTVLFITASTLQRGACFVWLELVIATFIFPPLKIAVSFDCIRSNFPRRACLCNYQLVCFLYRVIGLFVHCICSFATFSRYYYKGWWCFCMWIVFGTFIPIYSFFQSFPFQRLHSEHTRILQVSCRVSHYLMLVEM